MTHGDLHATRTPYKLLHCHFLADSFPRPVQLAPLNPSESENEVISERVPQSCFTYTNGTPLNQILSLVLVQIDLFHQRCHSFGQCCTLFTNGFPFYPWFSLVFIHTQLFCRTETLRHTELPGKCPLSN